MTLVHTELVLQVHKVEQSHPIDDSGSKCMMLNATALTIEQLNCSNITANKSMNEKHDAQSTDSLIIRYVI